MLDIDVLHGEIRQCTRCFDAGFPISLPAIASGLAPAPILLVGQAPSISDLRNDAMYTGPAGKRLLDWLRQAGFCDDDFGSRIYLTALTKCFPGRLPGKSTDRAPSAKERSYCRHWLQEQQRLVQPKLIIPFGKMAIDAFVPGFQLDEIVGTEIIRDGVTLIPLPHSSGASTWLNSLERQELLIAAIRLLSENRNRILA